MPSANSNVAFIDSTPKSNSSISIPNLNLGNIQPKPETRPVQERKGQLASRKISKKRTQLDFQDEFMSKYDEFSESWREQIDQQKRF